MVFTHKWLGHFYFATVSADSQNPLDSCSALQGRLRIRSFIVFAETFQRQKLLQHALGVDGGYAWFARNWATCTWWQCFANLKESMYNDQRKTFIQHVSDAKGSPGGSACTIGTERVVLCDSILCQQMIVSSYVCCRFGTQWQLCRMLWTSDRSSGWFASTYVRVNCTCDNFSRFTESQGRLMCRAG